VFEEAVKAVGETAAKGDARPTSPAAEDWMNAFERYAEDASSDELRARWGKVLAGELRARGSVSRQTLRFLSEVDEKLAADFEIFCADLTNHFVARMGDLSGSAFELNMNLEAAGLITGISGTANWSITLNSWPGTHWKGGGKILSVYGPEGQTLSITALILTRMGKEVADVLQHQTTESALRKLASAASRPPVSGIVIADVLSGGQFYPMQGEVLYSATPDWRPVRLVPPGTELSPTWSATLPPIESTTVD
jgi:hypothetical protein